MAEHWLSSERLTVWVSESYGVIEEAAPVVKRFIGQPMVNLVRWMQKQGRFRRTELCSVNHSKPHVTDPTTLLPS